VKENIEISRMFYLSNFDYSFDILFMKCPPNTLSGGVRTCLNVVERIAN
jgi:hypothetical protein